MIAGSTGSGNGVTPGQNYIIIGVTSWSKKGVCGGLSGLTRYVLNSIIFKSSTIIPSNILSF